MYKCGLCGISFTTEMESYEHDIGEKHHRTFEEIEFKYGRQPYHFCSICYCGGIQGFKCWINHTQNSRHRNNLKSFYEFYGVRHKAELIQGPGQSCRESKVSQKADEFGNGPRTRNMKRLSDASQSSQDKNISCNQLYKRPKVSNTPNVHEGGMMFNILETIDQESVNTQKQGKQTQKINSINSKGKCRIVSRRSTGKLHIKNKKSPDTNHRDSKKVKSKLTIHPSVYSEPIACRSTFPESITVRPVNEDGNKCEELQCIEKALIISQELQSLKIKQDELEEKLRNTEAELNLVKAKRRELKQQRSSLLRGLNHSDSDVESHTDTSRAELTDVRQHTTLPFQKSNVKVVASIAPLDAPSDVQTSHPIHLMSNQKSANKCQVDIPSTSSSNVTQSQQPDFQQPKNTVTSSQLFSETTSNALSTSCVPQIRATVSSQNTVSNADNPIPASSNSNGVDLERLALIRQALQSPDSWQFTFDEVDRMLKQAAAKVSTETSNRIVEFSEHLSQSRSTKDLPKTIKDKTTSAPIKGEPLVYPTATIKEKSVVPISKSHSENIFNPSTASDLPNLQLETSIHHFSHRKQANEPHAYSSSLTSPSNKDCRHEKERGNIDFPLPLKAKGEPDISHCLVKSESEFSNKLSSKSSIKIGEFHAFGGCATAVIDMAVHPIRQIAYIGGQNGTVVECDLKTHHCTSQLPPRDASITKLCLNPKGDSIFVGYYDHYFAEYNLQTSLLVHTNIFSSRIEALAIAPSPEVPFLFLGFCNGDILRYNLETHAIGYLFRQVPNSHKFDYGGDKTENYLKQNTETSGLKEPAGITSLCLVQSGTSLLLIVACLDRSISIRSASDGSLVCTIQSPIQKGPPQGISSLPSGSFFSSYSDRSIRIYNWKTGSAELTFHVHKITSSCVMRRYIAVGDSEGTVRVYKLQSNGLPYTRPIKVYFISTPGAVTSLACVGDTLIAGSLDGFVTVILINEPASDYVCLYGRKYGENCGFGFMDRHDLIHHVLREHLKFGSNKTVMCGWGSGRCRVRFTETQTMKSIGDHLLTHIPD
ncbi:zinc finger protein [Schistosoma japonicum]|uniref:Zinc finger protein n=2 Tax=Schistosoma japonicum TaxID=6182 RepID=A0A4Z2DW71_SCHJA|nr:zinc finger protein [Schistosoma japonicum]TNN20801.1 zinc finger protein [Schistosoma japonicum]